MKTILLLALATASVSALELTPGEKGINIAAGSLGTFQLEYPEFQNSGKKIHPLTEARTNGANAVLKYEGGVEIAISTKRDGEITYTLSNIPPDANSLASTLLIDISLNRGGKWKAGDADGAFPKEKPANPHFFSGNTTGFSFENAAADNLAIRLPDYTFLQLTDNREWNWAIYALRSFVPINAGTKTLTFKISSLKGSGDTVIIDKFGQSTLEEWPGKIKNEAELQSEVTADDTYYSSLKTPDFDPYGGFPGSRESLGLEKTGFFHIERKGDNTYLVDPAGNLFFHTGICGFQPSDDFTYIEGRQNIYAWLPKDDPAFATAFRPGDPTAFSFYVANGIRKFGQPHDPEAFAARMIQRVRKWGFNSMGAFSPVPASAGKFNFPYVRHLPLDFWVAGIPTIPGIHETWDPFDEKTRSLIIQNLAEKLPPLANDPLTIGYFVINEPRYDEIPTVLPTLDGTHACKREFVKYLAAKYKTVAAYNAAWASDATDFPSLNDKGLPVSTESSKADVKEFTGIFLETLFSLIETNFRKHDPNHLLLGYRYQPVTINDRQLCEITAKHADVMSYNYYTHEVDKEQLRRIHEWTGGKPMMLSEFFWSSPGDSGLSGGRDVHSQKERGLIYRNYVEQAASLGFVIGIEWFTLIDQAATGRWFSKYSGESSNSGLFSVADRPWKDAVTEMAKTNLGIYDVVLGKQPPFAWDEAAKRAK